MKISKLYSGSQLATDTELKKYITVNSGPPLASSLPSLAFPALDKRWDVELLVRYKSKIYSLHSKSE